MHFGIITPPVSGHLHPFGALGRELMERGHRVTVFHMGDLREGVEKEGLRFVEIGQSDHPRGSLPQTLAKLTQLHGLTALRFTIEAIRTTTEMICRDAPTALAKAGVDILLVDQTEPEGAGIAELLGLPFITVCNALLLNREPDIPPPFTSWNYSGHLAARLLHALGYIVSDRLLLPVTRTVAQYRQKWNLPAYKGAEDSFSKILQISQQSPAFDFPRRRLSAAFHYVGPLRKTSASAVPFPWEKLDGRPLVYASLGTLQNGKENVFRCFAEACVGLEVQLVITHGNGLTKEQASSFPGDPLVVGYAPQLEVLSRAKATLTHAGLNTVLDSLTHGVPLVAVPLTYEQPAIARRVSWTGVGKVMKFSRLNPNSLRAYLWQVLHDPDYAANARVVRYSIEQSGGVKRAAGLIEQAVGVPALDAYSRAS